MHNYAYLLLVGYNIAGCLWYLVEANRDAPEQYRKLFASMLSDWRAKWSVVVLAFIFPFG